MAEDPLNKECFFPPHKEFHELLARGYDRDNAGLGASRAAAPNGGMTRMTRDHLVVGRNYYRFCDHRRYVADWKRQATGGWWAEAEVFFAIRNFARTHAHIRDFARRNGQSGLSYAAQLHFAVPYEWGDCGAVVCATLTRRLDAWKGTGNIAYLSGSDPATGGDPFVTGNKRDPRDGGAKYIPLQKTGLYQLYIPDCHKHFDNAFEVSKRGPAYNFA